MLNTRKIYKCFLCMGLSVFFALTAIFPGRVYAYKCGDVITDEDIAKYFDERWMHCISQDVSLL